MRLLLTTWMFIFAAFSAYAAADVQKVSSENGITAWLIESHSLPMVQVQVAFRGGSAEDPLGQEGLAAFTAALLNESVQGMDAAAFADFMATNGVRLRTAAHHNYISLNMKTLTRSLENGFKALRLAATSPVFKGGDASRVRERLVAQIQQREADPKAVAYRRGRELIYHRHPYAHPTSGYEKSVSALQGVDAKQFHSRLFNRKNMTISVVGAITPQQLKPLLDKAFAAFPEGEATSPPDPVAKNPAVLKYVQKDIEQSHIAMGQTAIGMNHPRYFATLFMNHILGGGLLTSRLFDEVREKRGLAYGVRSHFTPVGEAGHLMFTVQTERKNTQKVIGLIKEEMRRMRGFGITSDEFNRTRAHFTDAFPLQVDTSAELVDHLTQMQLYGLGQDWLQIWTDKIDAVTREDVHMAAWKLLDPARQSIVIVGKREE